MSFCPAFILEMYSSREVSLPSDFELKETNIRSALFYPVHRTKITTRDTIAQDKPFKSKKLSKAVPVSCIFNDTKLD
jgi:hypothetical protein